jgi:PilZ domain
MLIGTREGLVCPKETPYRPRATRYEPFQSEACLTWRDERPELDQAVDGKATVVPAIGRLFALLLDISQTGAAIALDRVPRPGDGVWLGLEGDSWTPAEVVGVTTTTQGPHLVRLAFKDPCPMETLLAAICG